MTPRRWAWGAALAVSIFADAAGACTFEAGPSGALDVAYPGSLSVAVAIAGARHRGLLPPSDAPVPNFGYSDAESRIQSFTAALRPTFGAQRPRGFSLLLVGQRLWSAIQPNGSGYAARVHVSGPVLGQAVVMTDYIVLDALDRGQLSMSEALNAGLVRVVGSENTDQIKMLLRSGMRG